MTTIDAESLDLYVVRNEIDDDCTYHSDALSGWFPAATEVEFTAGDDVPMDGADGVILTGSTAAVYEYESRPWIAEQEALVRELVDREVPTLGVCFGHQVANTALGGTVEEAGTTATLVEADLADVPLFDDVAPVVVSLHSDVVTERGENMEVIATADHARVFGTRHQTAPLWTVQFHPEIAPAHHDRLTRDFGWQTGQFSFDDVTIGRVFENFTALVAEERE